MPIGKATFTAGLTATPYTAGDVVGGPIHLKGLPADTELMLTTSGLWAYIAANPSSAMTSFTLQMYRERPPSALADNTAWDLPSGDRAYHLGKLDLGTIADIGATLHIGTDAHNKHIKTGSEGLWAYLVTTAAYTPAGNAESYAASVAGAQL